MKLVASKILLIFFVLFSPSYLLSKDTLNPEEDVESLRSTVSDLKSKLEKTLKESRELRNQLDDVTQDVVGLKLELEKGGITSFLTRRSLETKLKESKEIEVKLNSLDADADSLSEKLISTKDFLINKLESRINELQVTAEDRRRESDTEGLVEALEEISKLHYELLTYRKEILKETLSRSKKDIDITLESDDSELEIKAKLDAIKQRENGIREELTLLEHQLNDLEVDKNLNAELLHLNQDMAEADLSFGMDFGGMSQTEKLEEKLLDIGREINRTKDRIAKLEVKAKETEILAAEFQNRLREFVEARKQKEG